jgi:hypothetical protein
VWWFESISAYVAASNEYHRQYKARRRAEYFQGKSCSSCGAKENLELDHIDPLTKDPQSRNIWCWSAERRDLELLKCQVLCNTCHKIKTRERHDAIRAGGGDPDAHGYAKYHRGCRCRVCKDANNAHRREYRKRKSMKAT